MPAVGAQYAGPMHPLPPCHRVPFARATRSPARQCALAVCLAWLCWGAQAAPEEAVFSSRAQESTEGWARVSENLAVSLVEDAGASDALYQCIGSAGLPTNYHQFLATKAIPLATDKARFFFVRPASRPYCSAFYGEHGYAFWLVDADRRVIYASLADALDVLPSSHNGMRDLLVSQCHDGYCYRTTVIFSTQSWREQSCTTTSLQTGVTVPGC